MRSAMSSSMIIDRNVAILMRDGAILRGDVFLPDNAGPFPVLITFGPYGKDVPLREFMPEAWDLDGYVVIRVDARGAGKSPGRLDPNSPAEFRDFYDAIEWAGSQPWC